MSLYDNVNYDKVQGSSTTSLIMILSYTHLHNGLSSRFNRCVHIIKNVGIYVIVKARAWRKLCH